MNIEDLLISIMGDSIPGVGDIGKPCTHPVKVYRVEMPNGRGPYNSGLGHGSEIYTRLASNRRTHGQTCWDCTHLAGENHEQMGITERAFRNAHGHASYGCDTLDALKNWFPEGARQYLRDEWSATVIEYEVQKGDYLLTVGNGEVIFNRTTAKEITRLDPVTLEKA